VGKKVIKKTAPVAIVICNRVASTDPGNVVPGSTRMRCGGCRALVWVSPSTIAIDGFPGVPLRCVQCAVQMSAPVTEVVAAPGAAAEIAAWERRRQS
jgi:hypothetical protein